MSKGMKRYAYIQAGYWDVDVTPMKDNVLAFRGVLVSAENEDTAYSVGHETVMPVSEWDGKLFSVVNDWVMEVTIV